jgi:hypothetical protein
VPINPSNIANNSQINYEPNVVVIDSTQTKAYLVNSKKKEKVV